MGVENKTLLFSILGIFLLLAVPSTAMVPGLPDVLLPNTYPDGAVMHLSFDEGTGTTANNSVDLTQNNGTLVDGVSWVPGWLESAVHFDSTNNVLVTSFDDLDGLSAATFIFWIKPETTPTGAGCNSGECDMIFSGPSFTIAFGLHNTRKVEVSRGDGVTWGSPSYTLSDNTVTFGEWQQVAIVINGLYDLVYINGVLGSNKTNSFNTLSLSSDITIGAGGGAAINYRDAIDEFLVFNRALSTDEITLIYQYGKPITIDTDLSINIRQVSAPLLDLTTDSAVAKAKFTISSSNSSAWVPIPISTVDISQPHAYWFNGSILTRSDNKYVAASSVNLSIPIQVYTPKTSEIPTSLFLDDDDAVKTFTYSQTIKLSNPGDIAVMLAPTIDISVLGAGKPLMNGNVMSLDNSSYKSVLYLGAGETKTMNLTAATTLTKQDVVFQSTFEDFLEIDTYAEAATMAENALAGKMDTKTRTILLETTTDMSYNNRSVIIPLKVDVNDVIEAKALSGSKELLDVRQGASGAELVIPESAWDSTFTLSTAQAKVIYNKEPSWYEGIPGLSAMGGFFKTLKNLFGGA